MPTPDVAGTPGGPQSLSMADHSSQGNSWSTSAFPGPEVLSAVLKCERAGCLPSSLQHPTQSSNCSVVTQLIKLTAPPGRQNRPSLHCCAATPHLC